MPPGVPPLSEHTFLVGAGASLALPAGLPLFGAIRASLLDQLGLDDGVRDDDDVRGFAERLAPEAFMSALHDGGLDLSGWLTGVLSRGEPNVVHHVLARAMERGAAVWSLNVDELVEAALGSTVEVASYDDPSPSASARLLKPHGTVSRSRYIFRSDQVTRPLLAAWAERLEADCLDRHLVVYGYAGADLDLRTCLNRAIAGARSVQWWAVVSEREATTNLLPALGRAHVAFRGQSGYDTLLPALLRWADSQGLTAGLPSSLLDDAFLWPSCAVPPVVGELSSARAVMYHRAGRPDLAREELVSALRRSPRKAPETMRDIAKIDIIAGAWWTPLLFAAAGGRLAPLIPLDTRARVDRAAVTRLSGSVDHKPLQRRIQRTARPDDPDHRIALAKSLRWQGRYPEALEELRCAEATVEAGSGATDVDTLAHLLFERCFVQQWQCDLDGAHKSLDRFQPGIGTMTSIQWIAWGTWPGSRQSRWCGGWAGLRGW